MTSANLIQISEDLRTAAQGAVNEAQQASLGQYFTPSAVAGLMAEMVETPGSTIRFLEPGAGTGALVGATVAELGSRSRPPESISVTCVESDSTLLPFLRKTLEACREFCQRGGIRFDAQTVEGDFIEIGSRSAGQGDLLGGRLGKFDVIVMNPPYRKINSSSKERQQLRRAGVEASNLYAGFLGLGVQMLAEGGQVVAITPRSFTNGSYFRKFRQLLLSEIALEEVYLFDSRSEAFGDTGVLQENVIIRGRRASPPETVAIGVGNGSSTARAGRQVPYDRVVWPRDPQKVLHFVASAEDQEASDWMRRLPATLRELGLRVSTGRVVDFRAKNLLRKEAANGEAPLLYPGHLREGRVRWPAEIRKPNYIASEAAGYDLLVPSAPYVLVKRFTSKEERRRVVAAVLTPEMVGDAPEVGIENHLNYFHEDGAGLDEATAWGLAAFLNTSRVDTFFRQFSGHTQVNATDLRMLRYPAREQLRELGVWWLARDRTPDQLEETILSLR